MLKGCQRRIIMVKDTGSRYFDSAYFVIKHDLPQNAANSDMLTEAHKMIGAYASNLQPGAVSSQPYADNQVPQIGKKGINPVLLGILTSVASVSLTIAVMLILT